MTAPLRALASAGKVRFAFGNATANVGIAKTSDCLLVTAEFAAKAGEAGAWLAQHGAARTPSSSTSTPSIRSPTIRRAPPPRPSSRGWSARPQVIVGHAETRDALESQVSAARGKVALVPDVSDLVYWPWRPAAAPTAPNAPLTVGYVSPGNESQRSLEILEALAASFDKTSGQAAIRWWGPIPVAFQHHVSILGGGHSAASHREHVRALANAPIDFAIVPEAGAAGERAWLDFATCHVACVVSCAAASPTIRHGETAVVAGDTPQAWIQTIAAFATETGVRAEIAQGAWLEVVTKRSIQQNVGLWLDYSKWRKLANRRSPPPRSTRGTDKFRDLSMTQRGCATAPPPARARLRLSRECADSAFSRKPTIDFLPIPNHDDDDDQDCVLDLIEDSEVSRAN
mgnify:CR=1 FL=1